MTTDRPYTDADLRAEAAKQHTTLTEDFDFMGIGERMGDNEPWNRLSDHDFDTAQNAIEDLLVNAADVSAWAINLGAAGLTPLTDIGVRITTGGHAVAVQIAADPGLTDDARRELAAELHAAIGAVVSRVLGCAPTA